MRVFFGALVLNFILLFNDIEASKNFLTNLLLQRFKTDKDRNRVDSPNTSRLNTPLALRQNQTSRGHEALDLHRPIPDIQESSKYVDDRRAIVSTPRLTACSASTDNPPLVEGHADSGVWYEYSSVRRPRSRRRPRMNPPTEESREIGADMEEVPDGLPQPPPQPQFLPGNINLNSDSREIDYSEQPTGDQRRRPKLTVRTQRGKDVSDSHDHFTQQSQPQQNAFQSQSLHSYGNPHYYWDNSGSSGSSLQH